MDGVLPSCLADEVAQEKFTMEESLKDVGGGPEPSAPQANEFDEQLDLAIALSLAEVSKQNF